MRSRDVSVWTQRSSFSSQSLRHAAILFSLLPIFVYCQQQPYEYSFFHLLDAHLLHHSGVFVCGCRDLILGWHGHLCVRLASVLMRNYSRALMEQQEFKLHLCWLRPSEQDTTHARARTGLSHAGTQQAEAHILLQYAEAEPHRPTLLSCSFITLLPGGISSLFVWSHYINLTLVLFKPNIYSTKWAFSFCWHS